MMFDFFFLQSRKKRCAFVIVLSLPANAIAVHHKVKMPMLPGYVFTAVLSSFYK
jgi:hypothetical protein